MSNKTLFRERQAARRRAFAAALNYRMELAGLNQLELADITGIPKDQISRYCNAKSFPRSAYQEILAKALKCTRSELCGMGQGLSPEGEYMNFRGSSKEGSVMLELRKSMSVEQAAHIMQILGGTGAAAAIGG